jgi:NTP pyrophosphatase (non-canonical NTP hydrolase)
VIETQHTICSWADKTFGYAGYEASLRRMLKEIDELKTLKFNEFKDADKIADECADVLITLYRIANVLNFDLHSCVDHKMEINRSRKWKSNGDGTGQHIKE